MPRMGRNLNTRLARLSTHFPPHSAHSLQQNTHAPTPASVLSCLCSAQKRSQPTCSPCSVCRYAAAPQLSSPLLKSTQLERTLLSAAATSLAS